MNGLELICISLPPQVLNEYFHNVCELDLVFNFYKVRIYSNIINVFIFDQIECILDEKYEFLSKT